MSAIITGLGWATPLGRDLDSVFQAVTEGRRLNPVAIDSGYGAKMPVLRVPEESVKDAAAYPRLRRSSTISFFAVAAALDAAASAELNAEKLARTVLIFTSSDGGVVYTRRFYAEIVERNLGAGSPLLFPETVYNASASHIAARLGIKGEALTLVGDSTAAITAVQTATELLATGEADYCLVVAAQEIDGVTWEAYARWGLVERNSDAAGSHLSEGAAAMVLAREGSGPVVQRVHSGTCYRSQAGAARAFDRMTADLLKDSSHPDLAVTGLSGTPLDPAEAKALDRHLPGIPRLSPKNTLGESQSSSTMQHLVTAALAIRSGQAGTVLVTANGFNQQIAALVLTHGDALASNR